MSGELMVERVATRLRSSKAWPAFLEPGSAEALVRVVLSELREPTQSIALSGYGVICDAEVKAFPHDALPGSLADDVWRAMIDAALAEGE